MSAWRATHHILCRLRHKKDRSGKSNFLTGLCIKKTTLKEKQAKGKKTFTNYLNKIEESINEGRAKLADKKEARDKAKLEKYIDDRLEYTSDCIALALLAADEAKLSFIEALEAEAEYEELYDED